MFQTNKNRLIYYSIVVDESRREVYEQRDPPNPTLKRESAELYTSESIPPLVFSTVSLLCFNPERLYIFKPLNFIQNCEEIVLYLIIMHHQFSCSHLCIVNLLLYVFSFLFKAFETEVAGGVTGLVCLRDELMVATGTGHIQRLRWDGSLNYDYCVDLRRVPFCDDQLVMKGNIMEEVCQICIL